MNNSHKIGLSLAGGGTKGAAHVGVIKALEENGLSPGHISGSSAGAVVGLAYAAGLDVVEIEKFVKAPSFFRFFSPSFSRDGLVQHKFLRKLIRKYFDFDDFESLSRKLYVTVSNLNTGLPEVISTGSLSDAVIASSSIPILYPPVTINGQKYVDGGLLDNMPIKALQSECKYIIGSNLTPQIHYDNNKLRFVNKIASRVFEMAALNNTVENLRYCDIVISSPRIYDYGVFDFKHLDDIIEVGYEATMEKLEDIKRLFESVDQ